jgi:7-keto-8-aminopelargonate synthetase-like enzyme
MANIAHATGVLTTRVPIIAVPIGDDDRSLFIKDELMEHGFDVAAFRYPSVKKAQLRITLHAGNTLDDIDELRSKLEDLL